MRKNIIKSTAILCAFTMILSSAPAMAIHAEETGNDDVAIMMDEGTDQDNFQDAEEEDNTQAADEQVDEQVDEQTDDQTVDEQTDDQAADDQAADEQMPEEENVDPCQDEAVQDEPDYNLPEDVNDDQEVAAPEDTETVETPANEEEADPAPAPLLEDAESVTTLTEANTAITLSKSSYVYNGKAKTPAVTVVCEDEELLKDVDYTVSYDNNVNAGKAVVMIQGIGGYNGTVTKAYTIAKAKQKFSAKANKKKVERKKKARITYSGAKGKVVFKSSNPKIAAVNSKGVVRAKKPGKVTITAISGATGNYKKAVVRTRIKVIGTVLTAKKTKIKLSRTSYTYNGKAKRPSLKVTFKGKTLKKGRDYKVGYKDNIDAGKATAVICGKGNYSGRLYKRFTINKANNHMKASIESTVIGIKEKTWVDVDNADGDVTFSSSNSKVAQVSKQGKVTGMKKGECTITVTAQGDENHKKAEKKFKVLVGPRAIDDKNVKVDVEAENLVYDGTAKRPDVNVTCNGMKLVQGEDYTAVYEDNINAGTGRIILIGKGIYKGTRVVKFQIEKAEQNDFTVAVPNDRIPLNRVTRISVKGGIGTISYGTYSPAYVRFIGGGWVQGLRKTNDYITITVTAAGNNNYKAKTMEKRVSIY